MLKGVRSIVRTLGDGTVLLQIKDNLNLLFNIVRQRFCSCVKQNRVCFNNLAFDYFWTLVTSCQVI